MSFKLDPKTVENSISSGLSIDSARRTLTGNDVNRAEYMNATTNIAQAILPLLKKLEKYLPAAQLANLWTSWNKILNDRDYKNGIKISNMVSFAGDLIGVISQSPYLPPQIRFGAFALSASLTVLSWGISELEDASEAEQKERERAEKLFRDSYARAQESWGEAWKLDDFLLYKVDSPIANESDGFVVFTLKFNHVLDKSLTIKYHTIQNTATEGKDYQGFKPETPGSVTIPAGVSEYKIKIPIMEDNEGGEGEENFAINIASDMLSYGIGKYILMDDTVSGVGTIIDKPIKLTVSNATVAENGGRAEFTVSIDRPVSSDIKLDAFASSVGTNSSDKDFTTTEPRGIKAYGDMVIKAGQTSTKIYVDIKDDEEIENDEKFALFVNVDEAISKKYNIKGDTLGNTYIATGTIYDDDSKKDIIVTIHDAASVEGDAGHHSMKFKVTLNKELQGDESIVLSTASGFITLNKNNQTSDIVYTWQGNSTPNEDYKFKIGATVWETSGNINVKHIRYANALIKDDDKAKKPGDPKYYDPLVVDLGGDGIELIKMNGAINFDHDLNGFAE
ncbi:Calx-beta domain-containing protein, partial [uncultured Campylobacter sp.]|uniref:Calx-beta domain-containing protein n=1 Tax=uncultured Campylobacter sp. TaxID=218934 RepID=UPI00262212AF